jgi:hypothetical protein
MATNDVEICNAALARIGAEAITSLTADAKNTDRMCNVFYAKTRDDLLKKYAWSFAKKATPLVRTDLYDTSDDYSDEVTITNVATSNPVVVTGTNSYSAGMHVLIEDISGTTQLNDLVFEVGTANAASFSLLGIDGAKFDPYTSGGTAIRVEPLTTYRNGYTYDIPSDCLKPRRLDSKTKFERFETRLVTADPEAVLIYTKAVTDTTKFSDEFEECLIAKLASILCMPLLGAKAGAQILPVMEAQYRQALAEAKLTGCEEEDADYSYNDTWITVRH